jgi:hypothetical protein
MHKKAVMASAVLLFAGAVILFAHMPGRVTGGPSVTTSSGMLVTSGFELYCQPDSANTSEIPVYGPNNLEVNWGPGNHWHMTQLLWAICSTDGESPAPPPNTASGPDIITLAGYGRCDGVDGVYGTFVFVDHGEPGIGVDQASCLINSSGACPGVSTGALSLISDGNIQFHLLQPNPPTNP